MPTRRRYTAKERAAAVGIAVADGVTAAERKTGIPKTTIDYWQGKPEFVQLRTTAREIVVEQFWIGMQVGLREVIKGIEGDAPLREKAEAMKIMADRYALLTGAVTSRTETLAVTDGLDDHEKAALRKVIDGVLEAVE
jgi:hypothetical protein